MYLRLGKVVGNGQALELLITLLLMKTLRNREAAPRIAGRLGVAQTLDLIGELTVDPAIKAWLPQARRAIAARNEAVHTAWFFESQAGVWDRRTLEERPRSPAELDQVVQLIHDAIESGRASFFTDPGADEI
ncbi:MAG TPA: hypothetical protein VIO80_01470 [Candidatus Dormibacteraeota bacterium]